MKFGVSTYSLYQKINSNEMDVLDVIQWVADHGADHVEIVPVGFDLENNMPLADAIRLKASEAAIDLSNYAVGANFITADDQTFEDEIIRIMKHVDIANRLGIKLMRHDVAFRPPAEATDHCFMRDLEKLSEACRRIADYAAGFGITTSVENHGYYIQASERVERLIKSVNRSNFRTTLDTGNFMCVDEDPVAACRRNISLASMVHLKDFYLRPSDCNPGEGWFPTASGNYLRGAILGQGDIKLREVLRIIKSSGYDGYISLEFEGIEDCVKGTRIGLDNMKRIWSEI